MIAITSFINCDCSCHHERGVMHAIPCCAQPYTKKPAAAEQVDKVIDDIESMAKKVEDQGMSFSFMWPDNVPLTPAQAERVARLQKAAAQI